MWGMEHGLSIYAQHPPKLCRRDETPVTSDAQVRHYILQNTKRSSAATLRQCLMEWMSRWTMAEGRAEQKGSSDLPLC